MKAAIKSFLDYRKAFNCIVSITYLLSHQAKAKMRVKHFLLPGSLVLEATLVQYTKQEGKLNANTMLLLT